VIKKAAPFQKCCSTNNNRRVKNKRIKAREERLSSSSGEI